MFEIFTIIEILKKDSRYVNSIGLYRNMKILQYTISIIQASRIKHW